MSKRDELTTLQWERVYDFLPGKSTDPGRTAGDPPPESRRPSQ